MAVFRQNSATWDVLKENAKSKIIYLKTKTPLPTIGKGVFVLQWAAFNPKTSVYEVLDFGKVPGLLVMAIGILC